jgi:hypothetical protein
MDHLDARSGATSLNRPSTLRFAEATAPVFYDKGYLYNQFPGAFPRYLGDAPKQDRNALCSGPETPKISGAKRYSDLSLENVRACPASAPYRPISNRK